MNIDKLIGALTLAAAAKKYANAIQYRRQAELVLKRAYASWKLAAGFEFVERGSDAWRAMTEATSAEYKALAQAKRKERHHRDRLVKLACEGEDVQ